MKTKLKGETAHGRNYVIAGRPKSNRQCDQFTSVQCDRAGGISDERFDHDAEHGALERARGQRTDDLQQVLAVVGDKLSIPYCVLDGAFGNHHALQMVRRLDLHLVSKLAKNSALYFPYTGEQKKVGNRRKDGSKLDYQQIPNRYRTASVTADGVRTDLYQMTLWSKAFPDPLNIVIIVRSKLAIQECAHVVLFSSDLNLAP